MSEKRRATNEKAIIGYRYVPSASSRRDRVSNLVFSFFRISWNWWRVCPTQEVDLQEQQINKFVLLLSFCAF